MTLYHFGNCIALAYGPYFLTYKCSGLPEYGAFWKCVQVGAMYMLTQLCKMLILATFFPASELPSGIVTFSSEFIKTTIDFGDLIGLSIIMGRIAGSGHIKVLVTGLGWAAADLFLTRALPLWVGARGIEFDWKYIQMSLDANISLVHHLTVVTLLWLWCRSDLTQNLRPAIALLLMVCIYRPLLPFFVAFVTGCYPAGFVLLSVIAVPTICIAVVSLYLFVSHCSISRIY